jgi:hypothetical protein
MASQERLEEIVQCSICLDRIQNPKVLPCQHSFCLDPCLRGIAAAHEGRNGFLRCPECRAEHQIPYYGVDDFPTNLTLAHLLEVLPTCQDSIPRVASEKRQVPSATTELLWSWVRTEGGSIPPGAFAAGRDLDGETLYVGRAPHLGSLTPGKVSRSIGGCLLPWGGAEHGKMRYEILVGTANWVQGDTTNIPGNAIEGEKSLVSRYLNLIK